MAQDTRHEITIRTVADNRPRNFLIGLAVLYLLWCWYSGGQLLRLCQAASDPEGFSGPTITETVLLMAYQLIAVVGAVAVGILFGIWDFVYGIGRLLWQAVQTWQAKNAAIAAAQEAAKEAAVGAATEAALEADPAAEEIDPAEITTSDLVGALERMADEIDKISGTVRDLQDRAEEEPVPAQEPVKAASPRRTAQPRKKGSTRAA